MAFARFAVIAPQLQRGFVENGRPAPGRFPPHFIFRRITLGQSVSAINLCPWIFSRRALAARGFSDCFRKTGSDLKSQYAKRRYNAFLPGVWALGYPAIQP